MKHFLIGLLASLALHAGADDGVPHVLVQALLEGHASQILTREGPFGSIVKTIQARTGDTGNIEIVAARLLRFKQQPDCGRVVFAIAQPSSHRAWSDMGGQLNLCASGSPPLRSCDDSAERLVLPDALCRDGKPPRDTPEVASAISQALRSGSLSQQQLQDRLNGMHPRD